MKFDEVWFPQRFLIIIYIKLSLHYEEALFWSPRTSAEIFTKFHPDNPSATLSNNKKVFIYSFSSKARLPLYEIKIVNVHIGNELDEYTGCILYPFFFCFLFLT